MSWYRIEYSTVQYSTVQYLVLGGLPALHLGGVPVDDGDHGHVVAQPPRDGHAAPAPVHANHLEHIFTILYLTFDYV